MGDIHGAYTRYFSQAFSTSLKHFHEDYGLNTIPTGLMGDIHEDYVKYA
jgi:hypothetical protein